MISNAQTWALLVGAVFIAFGFIPIPMVDPSLPKATWFEWLIAVLPLFPLFILTLSVVCRRRIPLAFARFLALMLLWAGALMTTFLMAFSGGGHKMVLLHGTALTLACAMAVLLASDTGQKVRSFAFGSYVISVLVGVWSLAAVPLAYASALKISASHAFCIGEIGRAHV